MAEAPEASPQCDRCWPVRVFADSDGLAMHRKGHHGIPLPPEVLERVERRGGKNTPSVSPRTERVPAMAIGLLWIRYPRDAATCSAIVERIDSVLWATSDSERLFWDPLRDVVAAIGGRGPAAA
jgi:hypothetical protein